MDFEKLVRQIRVCFEEGGPTASCLKSSAQAALRIVERFFDADRCALALVEYGDKEVIESFAANLSSSWDDVRLHEITSLVEADEHRPIVRVLPARETGCFPKETPGLCMLLAVRVSNQLIAVSCLGYDGHRPRFCSSEIQLLELATAWLCQYIDIQRKRTECNILKRRLEHAERLQAVGALVGEITHEFNNILGGILGYAETARTALRRSAVTRTYVDQIISSSHRARLIIDQILTLSRKVGRVAKPFSVVELVIEVAPLLRVALQRNIELNFKFVDKTSVIEGSPLDIQLILMNLCKNASQAIVADGQIDVIVGRAFVAQQKISAHDVMPAGEYVVLSVSDNGEGIPEDVLPHIYEPFFTARSRKGGTGLGLATVYSRVSELAGYIKVTSTVGQGTRFDIYLPSSSQEPVSLDTLFGRCKTPRGSGQIVALVEPDPILREVYENKIADLGYEPVGFEAFKELYNWMSKGEQADLVLVEQSSLPHSKSATALHAVFKTTSIIIGGNDLMMSASRDAMMTALFLPKPMSFSAMAYAIHMKIKTCECELPTIA